MKTKTYYRRLLAAIRDATTWAGSMEPAQGDTYEQEMRELRREVKRRQKASRRTPGIYLYLKGPSHDVLSGRAFKRNGRWWFKGDGLGSKPERLSDFRREGYIPFDP